jgi:ribosomal protein S18 acetylase RimI-like enzyme
MPDLVIDLPAPRKRAKSADSFVQTIDLMDGPTRIGRARWQCVSDLSQGVVQILELTVAPKFRRRGHAHRLMEAVTTQAGDYFKAGGARLRRLWIAVEQKEQVIARSFLMQFGFHHVGTVSELLKDQDLLIYMRTFD